jgi:hypothetical protein
MKDIWRRDVSWRADGIKGIEEESSRKNVTKNANARRALFQALACQLADLKTRRKHDSDLLNQFALDKRPLRGLFLVRVQGIVFLGKGVELTQKLVQYGKHLDWRMAISISPFK